MIRLLLDSSGRDLSVAIAHQNRIIKSVSYAAWQQQSELLVPEIKRLIASSAYDFQHIEAVHVASGPGSYTGVRIALTVAKIIGFALKVPVYAASSLEILKVSSQPTICLINARSKRSYFGVYEGDKAIVCDTIKTNDEVFDYIHQHPDYALSGDLEYLGLTPKKTDIFLNLLLTQYHREPISDIHALKPMYLKDNL